MDDMYSFVKNHEEDKIKQKKKKDIVIAVLITVVAVILFVAGYLIYDKVTYQHRFDNFLTYVNNSTIYAFKNDSLYADFGEGPVHITGENDYEIYKCMVVYGPATERSAEKKSDGTEVILTYGDGGVLRMWDVCDDEGGRHMYVKYENGGYSHMFSTKFTSASVLISRYLTEEVNNIEN